MLLLSQILRRLVVLYLMWMFIGMGFFMYMTYYPILLDEPICRFQLGSVIHRMFDWWVRFSNNNPKFIRLSFSCSIVVMVETVVFHFRFRLSHDKDSSHNHSEMKVFKFMAFVLPAVCTAVNFLLLSPVLMQKHSIANTLYCNGDLRFFGDPFPERIVDMSLLRKSPKPSRLWTYELLVYRNLVARLTNLAKRQFWKLLWRRWVCRGLTCGQRKGDSNMRVLDYIFIILWLPLTAALLVLHVLPCFSVWANHIRKQLRELFLCSWPRCLLVTVLLLIQLLGIFALYLMIWDFVVIGSQFCVFMFIDILRNAATTLSKIILILGIVTYLRNAFEEFEDGYRELKSMTFSLCIELAEEAEEEEGAQLVVSHKPFEPLLVKSKDGEASIPRRIFYEICHAYKPYNRSVAATFSSLFVTFTIITVIFLLIVKFNIFEQFSEVGEPLLTVATVSLPTVLGVSKSSSHQGLSEQRRDLLIKTWLENNTTVRKVQLNLDKRTKQAVWCH